MCIFPPFSARVFIGQLNCQSECKQRPCSGHPGSRDHKLGWIRLDPSFSDRLSYFAATTPMAPHACRMVLLRSKTLADKDFSTAVGAVDFSARFKKSRQLKTPTWRFGTSKWQVPNGVIHGQNGPYWSMHGRTSVGIRFKYYFWIFLEATNQRHAPSEIQLRCPVLNLLWSPFG